MLSRIFLGHFFSCWLVTLVKAVTFATFECLTNPSQLGIPTANIPITGLTVAGHDDLQSGVYFGFAGLEGAVPTPSSEAKLSAAQSTTNTPSFSGTGKGTVYPMVMSMGYNPFYKNSARSVEVHIMHDFAEDFYGAQMKLLILGFIRPELDYVSREALIEDIQTDIQVGGRSLEREAWKGFANEPWLVTFDHKTEGT